MSSYSYRNSRRRSVTRLSGGHDTGFILIVAAVIVLVVLAFGFSIANATHTEVHNNCVVTDKDRTSVSDGKGNSHSDARVYTENCGVFQVADSLLSWTWSSSDTYGSIKKGETYDFTTRGYRLPFFSAFPNIVEVDEQ